SAPSRHHAQAPGVTPTGRGLSPPAPCWPSAPAPRPPDRAPVGTLGSAPASAAVPAPVPAAIADRPRVPPTGLRSSSNRLVPPVCPSLPRRSALSFGGRKLKNPACAVTSMSDRAPPPRPLRGRGPPPHRLRRQGGFRLVRLCREAVRRQ